MRDKIPFFSLAYLNSLFILCLKLNFRDRNAVSQFYFNFFFNHHNWHFFSGFIFDPRVQPQALAKSGELESVPITLSLCGE